jgi:hypothetical protein
MDISILFFETNKWLSDEPFCINNNRLFETSVDKKKCWWWKCVGWLGALAKRDGVAEMSF